MDMHLESTSREAFELVTDALECIDRYRESRDVGVLESAKGKLVTASEIDPGYFRAHYYDAIVDDLAGHPGRAVETFTRLLGQQPPFASEVRYNLGVAWYHHYHHEALERAIEHFTTVARSSADPSLHLLAHAGLAQAHAMHMIPKSPERPDLAEIQRHFDLAMEEAARVLRELPRKRRAWPLFRKSAVPPATVDEIGWTIHNARGMALMYYTDHLPVSGGDWNARRITTLREAIDELDRADRISPRNWANHCDMASARMRLGYYEQSPAMFSHAFSLLELVIDRLRPGYGFAIYEMGRIDRLRHDFESAAGRFERILAMPKEERLDIDDARLKIELARARAGDPSFP